MDPTKLPIIVVGGQIQRPAGTEVTAEVPAKPPRVALKTPEAPIQAGGSIDRHELLRDAALVSALCGEPVASTQAMQRAIDGALAGLEPRTLPPDQIEDHIRAMSRARSDLRRDPPEVAKAIALFDGAIAGASVGAREKAELHHARAELLARLAGIAPTLDPTRSAEIERRVRDTLAAPIDAANSLTLAFLRDTALFKRLLADDASARDALTDRALSALPFLRTSARLDMLKLMQESLDLPAYASSPARATALEHAMFELLETAERTPRRNWEAPTWDERKAWEAEDRGRFSVQSRAADLLGESLLRRLERGDDLAVPLRRIAGRSYGGGIADSVTSRFLEAPGAQLNASAKTSLIALLAHEGTGGVEAARALLDSGQLDAAEKQTLVQHLLRHAYVQDDPERPLYANSDTFKMLVGLHLSSTDPAVAAQIEEALTAVAKLEPQIPGTGSSAVDFYNESILRARAFLALPRPGRLRGAEEARFAARRADGQLPKEADAQQQAAPTFHALFAGPGARDELTPEVRIFLSELQFHLKSVIPDLEKRVREGWGGRAAAALSVDAAVAIIDQGLANPTEAMRKGAELMSSDKAARLVRGGGIGAASLPRDTTDEVFSELRKRAGDPALRSRAVVDAALRQPRSFVVEGDAGLPMPKRAYLRERALGAASFEQNLTWMAISHLSSLHLEPSDQRRWTELVGEKPERSGVGRSGVGLPSILRVAVARAAAEGRPLRILEVSDGLGLLGFEAHGDGVWNRLGIKNPSKNGAPGVESVSVARQDLLWSFIEEHAGRKRDGYILDFIGPALGFSPYGPDPAKEALWERLDALMAGGAYRRMTGRDVNRSLEKLLADGERFDLVLDSGGVLASSERVRTLELMQRLLQPGAVGLVAKTTQDVDLYGRVRTNRHLSDEVVDRSRPGQTIPIDQALAAARPGAFLPSREALILVGTEAPQAPLEVESAPTPKLTAFGYPVALHRWS
ncbi:MAG: hypothetical protein IT384_28280 [Deltaproteobacteria bacterium]|nr:hypothetical protein [Deltaproteobacteria bacterium]